MVALVVALGVVVLLLAVLVAGLLRSHADILKSLHDLGVGVGDPGAADADPQAPHPWPTSTRGPGDAVPVTMGPPLPPERNSTSAPTVAGVTPDGHALAVSMTGGDHLTLLAFLSSGCASCSGFWKAFHRPGELGLPDRTRLVVVTKGPDREIPAEVAAQSPRSLPVVMSTEAWDDYEVPGSPFFVLVDAAGGRRIGEGVANHIHQVVDLVRRADVDARPLGAVGHGPVAAGGLDGPERERANDAELRRAGVLPGDPSLYPASLDDLYGRSDQPGAPAPVRRTA